MEHPRNIQPSQQSLEDPVALSRAREVLSHTAGNSQHFKQALASVGFHNDHKASHLGMDPPNFTVPSQPSRKSLANTLELRRQSTRRQRTLRIAHNPIEHSPQYRAYRERQHRDGNPEDQKWPAVLEDAFLNALLWIPKMGRRKFSYQGKPHGRNELIKEYLWLAYVQSLPPGERPDPTMMRHRKQVSSHIQVLKGFMKDHPDFDRLFPKKNTPNNGFEDSFKNDPCLRALTEGRIYTGPSGHSSNRNQTNGSNHRVKPAVFWLLITSESVPDDPSGRYTSKEDLYRDGVVAHEYTGLGSQRRPDGIESVPSWREKFPYLEQIYSRNELNCDLIHMNVSLQLMRGYAQRGAELVTRVELSIPGKDFAGHQWQTVTTLVKPLELYHDDQRCDPPMQHKNFHAEVVHVNEHETRVKVPFPANSWAHAFTCLTNIQLAYEENRKGQSTEDGATHGSARPARDYVDQISMYQEVHSSSGPGKQFVRRAIIFWTFQKARNGESGSASWRNLDPHPPRRTCMSPSPHPSHHISAAMNENFNSWADSPMYLQTQNMMDPFVQGLATPPTTAGLQSPFAQGYGYNNQQFDIPQENLSFVSSATIDSEDTLVGHETTANIDSFLSNANVHLSDFEHNSNGWHLPHTESFSADPAWAYNVPASTPQVGWDTKKNHAWPESSPSKHVPWIVDANGKHGEHWNDPLPSPAKRDQNYIEATLEQKLVPWIDHHVGGSGEAAKNDFPETNEGPLTEVQMESMENGTSVTKDHEEHWNGVVGGFDYDQLAERLM